MYDDWIPMRIGLASDIRIARMAEVTKKHVAHIIGAWQMVWSIANEHTTDGILLGYSDKRINAIVGIRGFSEAAIGVGWFQKNPGGMIVVKFDRWNSQGAKRRHKERARKAAERSDSSAICPQENGQNEDKNGTDCALQRQTDQTETERSGKPEPGGGVSVDGSGLAGWLDRTGVGEPARSAILACPAITLEVAKHEWGGCRGATYPVRALVARLKKLGADVPKSNGTLSAEVMRLANIRTQRGGRP